MAALGARVHGIVRNANTVVSGIEMHTADIRDGDAITSIVATVKPSVIVHCAAHGGNQAETDAEAIFASNVIGTHHLLRAAVDNQCDSFLYTGTSSEYGPNDEPMRVADRLAPMSEYAIGKAAGTHLCALFAEREGLNTLSFRLFTIYGPGMAEARLIPVAMNAAAQGIALPLTGGTVTHDFVYIDDVIDAFLRAAPRTDLGGRVVNLCTGIATTNDDVVKAIERASGRTINVDRGAYAEHTWDTPRWHGDNSEAKEILDWEPANDLDTGLKKFWEFRQG